MKRKLLAVTAFFAAAVILVTAALYLNDELPRSDDARAGQLVLLNEIVQSAKNGGQPATDKVAELEASIRGGHGSAGHGAGVLWQGGISLAFVLVVFGYVYFAIFVPFCRMQNYATEIAKGNFDLPLTFERSNYFGPFTWAFDSMRREITKARACEREAVENNKTVIATLSHDIKTPIASIRAYAEGLEAHMDSSPERRARYLRMIMDKCDEAARLTDDLFLHSLSDLEKLKIHLEPVELCDFVREAVGELAAERGDVHLHRPDFSATVNADPNRLMQIVENLVNNARKYAKSDVDVSLAREGDTVRLIVTDHGPGIPDEDMPFIFDKFYRGKNCGREQGSGLGLYIVKYLTEKMGGSVTLHSRADGLRAEVAFPVAR